MTADVACVGLMILDVLGRPVERIPDGGNVEFIGEIRLTVAGTAGGTVVDCAKPGLKALAGGTVGDDEKGDFVLDTYRRYSAATCAAARSADGRLWKVPSFMIASRLSASCRIVTSASGSPSTSRMSAR